jgi:hypothetical protein
MKRLALLLLLPSLASAGEFVTNPATTLPGPKSDARALPAGSDANKYLRAPDFNALRDAANDLRDYVRAPNDAQVTATGSSTARALKDRAADEVWITDHGAACNVTTDDSAAFVLAVAKAMETGKTLRLPAGVCRIDSIVTLPNDGATPPNQKPLRIVGAGAQMTGGVLATTSGGTVLDMRASGAYGKLVTSGLGYVEISGVTFKDSAGTSTPFVYTTNTTLHIHDSAFIGTKLQKTCDQDAIILGGTEEIEGGGGLTHGFQGYGTVIRGNYFNRIRRAVYGRVFANGVIVRDNTIWWESGSNLAGGAAIEFDNPAVSPVQGDAGSVIAHNLIEVKGYPYGVKLGKATQFSVVGNNMYDPDLTPVTGTLAAVRIEASGTSNFVQDGFVGGSFPNISDAGVNTTHISVSLDQGRYTKFGNPVDVTKSLLVAGVPRPPDNRGALLIQPAAVADGNYAPLGMYRSAAESSGPNEKLWGISYAGIVSQGNVSGAGSYNGPYSTWVNGRSWSSVGTVAPNGATMTQDSGPGGNYFDHKNYAVRFYDYNAGPLRLFVGGGQDQIRFGPLGATDVGIIVGNNSPEGYVTAPIGSLFLSRNGNGGTQALWVKQSGTGNTGWASK